MPNNTRLCYFPDGSIAKNNVPCTGAPHTACCGASDICLSNGFCMNINHQPWSMSRGACTNQAWDGGCPDRCISENDYPHGGCSIINLSYEAGEALYCCGTLVSDGNGKVVCPNGANAFSLEDAHALPGYGLLSNLSNFYTSGSMPSSATETSSCTAETCHDTAIGAGVGVPLGVIALASLGWAFLERKRARAYARLSAQSARALPTSQMGSKYPGLVELESRHPAGELMAREQT
ncbi:hypothetical protein BJX96DRAFT_146403 [Aspergillus floccosus]